MNDIELERDRLARIRQRCAEIVDDMDRLIDRTERLMGDHANATAAVPASGPRRPRIVASDGVADPRAVAAYWRSRALNAEAEAVQLRRELGSAGA